ncbi:hypothetical protein E2C01_054277 [Portunus trituberculatus]|uniref:Uncharacterized protein n=1 Tax=Portunus trituberculatus TaxID=210409 RepID=A0A5B7GTB2_PORTR|nr:hypothetical protein [Portunus trituberculatus]
MVTDCGVSGEGSDAEEAILMNDTWCTQTFHLHFLSLYTASSKHFGSKQFNLMGERRKQN